MRLPPLSKLIRADSDQGKRRFGRLPQETLSCNLGEVLDLSPGGMRISCWRIPAGDVLTILIDDHAMEPPLRGRVVWSHRVGWIKCEMGIEFEGLTAEQSSTLMEISRDCRLRRSM